MNELVIRNLLHKRLAPKELVAKILKLIADPSILWEEKRSLFHFLYNTGQDRALITVIKEGLENKTRVPFDLLIDLSARVNIQPPPSVIESLLKGLKKQHALDEVITSKGWDKWDTRLTAMRAELIEQKVELNKNFKENMIEKYMFLKNQRMTEQAGRVLKRLLELFPEDPSLAEMKKEFDEDWARNVLSTHMATLQSEAFERTRTQPSAADEAMLKLFLSEGEKAAFEHRQFAFELAIGFWFMEHFEHALEILQYAPPGLSTDWLRAELLFAARRFLEALEQINMLEVRYIDDPETTFAVSYLRAQCLHGLGQDASALEILQSIVRVRAQYRSAHALILEWTAGGGWE